MEVVKKEGEEKEQSTQPQAQPAEMTREEHESAMMQALMTDYIKAEGYAKMIHEKTIGQWVTMHRVSQLVGLPVSKVQELFNFISQFYLLERKSELNVFKYHIQLDPTVRLKGNQFKRQQLKDEIMFCDTIAQMIVQEIDDKNSKTTT